MVRLEKMKNEELVDISKKMFIGGFFLLPWLWMVNFLFFYKLIKHPELKPDLDPRVRKYVIGSLIGSIVMTIPFIVWFIVYQIYRPYWGVPGERLSVTIPHGY